jgi:hypothetical protein
MHFINLRLLVLCLIALVLLMACGSADSSSNQATRIPEPDSSRDGRPHTPVERQHENPSLKTKLYPIDEGPRDPSFAEFRDQLVKSVQEHDAAFILSILDEEIVNTSDGKGGVHEFKDQWKLDQPGSKLWETLGTTLSMGGRFRVTEGNRKFCAPYVTTEWPTVVSQLPKGSDPLDYRVIIDKDVTMYSAPNVMSQIIAQLSYDVVNVPPSQVAGSAWLKIKTLDGKEGYVADKYIRGATDHQACFEKRGRKWLMTEFSAKE